MINKKNSRILAVIGVITVITTAILITKSLKTKSKQNTKDFNSFISDVNNSKSDVRNTTTNLKPEYQNWLKDDKLPFTEKELDDISVYANQFQNSFDNNIIKSNSDEYDENKLLTYDKAKKDTDRLFNLFKYGYSAYGYYGGDSKFNDVKEKVLSSLPKDKSFTVDNFRNILVSNLSFINDQHFDILDKNNRPSFKGKYYYIYDEPIYKDSTGYYEIKHLKRYYIQSMDGNNKTSDFIHKTIGKKGNIIYNIAIMNDFTNDMKLSRKITLKSKNGQETSETIDLSLKFFTANYNTSYEYTEQSGIPIVKLSRFYNVSQSETDLNDFIDSASQIKSSPVAILDLRGNTGGYNDIAQQWIINYFGVLNDKQNIYSRGATMELHSSLIKSLNQTSYDELFKEFPGHKSKIVKNKNILFILMDNATASASEKFIESLSNIDNIVLVGTNTKGALLSGDPKYYKLSNSSINVYIGTILYMTPFGIDFEGKGFEPDLLVDSNDALDKTIKLIKYYKLK
ncbi:S41 family peptidase [Inconstantimicrobium porci]|uniref:S41 family peptidase n=1 Tax=Inconstantimicrobium porci TaxID=2652291 RepID=UPI0024094A94|nr:S41 family peptidase [Inconstantimicrobium porci]MDD6771833.1 S41 family peptidase [Inconstantimicrobium porci]